MYLNAHAHCYGGKGVASTLAVVLLQLLAMAECWMNRLQKKGLYYYEGIIDSIEEFLEDFKRQTVTSWGGTRTSSNLKGHVDQIVSLPASFVSIKLRLLTSNQTC